MLVWCSRPAAWASRRNRARSPRSRQELQRHVAVERALVRLADDPHAAPADLADDPELAPVLGHRGQPSSAGAATATVGSPASVVVRLGIRLNSETIASAIPSSSPVFCLAFGADVEMLASGRQLVDGELPQHEIGERRSRLGQSVRLIGASSCQPFPLLDPRKPGRTSRRLVPGFPRFTTLPWEAKCTPASYRPTRGVWSRDRDVCGPISLTESFASSLTDPTSDAGTSTPERRGRRLQSRAVRPAAGPWSFVLLDDPAMHGHFRRLELVRRFLKLVFVIMTG